MKVEIDLEEELLEEIKAWAIRESLDFNEAFETLLRRGLAETEPSSIVSAPT